MMAAKMFFNACSEDEAHPYQSIFMVLMTRPMNDIGASFFHLGNHNSGRCLCECATANS
jgi:hypothetical protein